MYRLEPSLYAVTTVAGEGVTSDGGALSPWHTAVRVVGVLPFPFQMPFADLATCFRSLIQQGFHRQEQIGLLQGLPQSSLGGCIS